MSILEAIFRETDAHQRITRKMEEALGKPPSLDRYLAVLKRMYGLYLPLEVQFDDFAQVCNLQEVQLQFSSRRKMFRLERDLVALGVPVNKHALIPVCEEWPPLDSVPRILGTLFVIEGSTLGGQVTAGRMETALGINTLTGSAFFRSYGPESVLPMWEEFCRALNSFADLCPDQDTSIVQTAVEVFLLSERWLFPELPEPAPGSSAIAQASTRR